MIMNREEYLGAATKSLAADVFGPAGYTVPDDVKLTCGWPSKGATSAKKMAIGECWPRSRSADSVNEIFISPVQADTITVLDVLTHELVHATLDCKHGHKAPFRKIAVAVGLEGKMTSTIAGEALTAKLEAIRDALGDYPHAELTPPPPKEKSRQLKAECLECGWIGYQSKKFLDKVYRCCCCPSENVRTG